MAGGSPRKVSFPPEEMIALGKEMISWVKEHNPVHLSQWWCIEKHFIEKQWETFQHREEFVPYYEEALRHVGMNYLLKGSDVEPSLKQRWQRVYFKDIRTREDQDAQEQIDRESKSLNTLTAPNQEELDMKHENMRLKNEIEKLKADANKS